MVMPLEDRDFDDMLEQCTRLHARLERMTRIARERGDDLAFVDDHQPKWLAIKAERDALRTGIEALAVEFEMGGIVCACGHDVGTEHNGMGCYARISYQPLTKCPCMKTDDQDLGDLAAAKVRGLL